MYPRWFWPILAIPGVAWLVLLFVVPFYAVVAVALGDLDPIFRNPVPYWNPLEWNVGYLNFVLERLLPGEVFWTVFVRTFVYVACALALSLAIGYPVAYYIARHGGRWKTLLLVLLILPFWISYLMRMLAV
jgi:ABC-type spermidine/putrescine transport system permease subunit I